MTFTNMFSVFHTNGEARQTVFDLYQSQQAAQFRRDHAEAVEDSVNDIRRKISQMWAYYDKLMSKLGDVKKSIEVYGSSKYFTQVQRHTEYELYTNDDLLWNITNDVRYCQELTTLLKNYVQSIKHDVRTQDMYEDLFGSELDDLDDKLNESKNMTRPLLPQTNF